MRLTVLLFAAGRARAGSSSLEVELAEPATVAQLKQALVHACPALGDVVGSARIAVNAAYAEDADPITAGSEVALIPPVSGGMADSRASVTITSGLIDHGAITDSVRSRQAGAICSFMGTVRELTAGKQTTGLEYEAYGAMAERLLDDLASEALQRWPIERLAIVHRVGPLGLGEVAVVVAVSTPHRAESFEACRWLIDTIKEVVPIWKKEEWADGTEEWVKPGDS